MARKGDWFQNCAEETIESLRAEVERLREALGRAAVTLDNVYHNTFDSDPGLANRAQEAADHARRALLANLEGD